MNYYVIRVDGALPDDALADFEGLSVTRQPARSVVRADVASQDELAEVLAHLNGLGAVIDGVVNVRPPTANGPHAETARA